MNNLITKISNSRFVFVLWIISGLLYVTSMFFPAFGPQNFRGWVVALFGFGTIVDLSHGHIIPFLAWVSNAIVVFSLVIMNMRKCNGIVFPIVMTLFTIIALWFPSCMLTSFETGQSYPVGELYTGYYLWTASQILTSVLLWLRFIINNHALEQQNSAVQ